MAENTGSASDILIVGAGIFGTSTAYHLSKSHPSPDRIKVIDRTPFPPTHGASTDINKIIRLDYGNSFYMELAAEAMKAWTTWPELGQKGYFHKTGWVAFHEKGGDLAHRVSANFRARGSDPTVSMSLEEVRKWFGAIFQDTDMSRFEDAYHNPEVGWCDAGSATAEMMKVAVERGVQYVTGNVDELLLSDSDVRGLKLADGSEHLGEKVLLASGAWTSALMSSAEDVLKVPTANRFERQAKASGVCVAHYRLHSSEVQLLEEMPVIIYGEVADVQPPPKNNLLKFTNAHSFTNTVATPSGQRISRPPDRDQSIVSDQLKREMSERVTSRLLPQFTGRPVEYWRICWDAVTPSQDHLITRHPDPRLRNLYFAVGGSLHSYKFLPTIGQYVVKVLAGESNGEEKDRHWAWREKQFVGRGAHEKVYPQRELWEAEGG
ncbi:MAG: hypothetical protein M1831_005470 [Alyxoria varia]|nr:MAG: hypothetical protein M1831_005470 [Alyxoria varia]